MSDVVHVHFFGVSSANSCIDSGVLNISKQALDFRMCTDLYTPFLATNYQDEEHMVHVVTCLHFDDAM